MAAAAWAQARGFIVVAYNGEHLVDLDGVTWLEDYKPKRYTPTHALTKLRNFSRLMAKFEHGRGPDVILLNELETDNTPAAKPVDPAELAKRYAGTSLEVMLGAGFTREIGDLPIEVLMLKALEENGMPGYRAVVGDQVVVTSAHPIEQKCAVFTRFPIRAARSHATVDARAILEVQLEVDGALLYVFSNHWKSGASDPATEKTRVENAKTLRTRLDEILRDDPNADIIIGGDLNSMYNHKQRYPALKPTGINDILGSQGNELAIRGKERDLYNLWYELPLAERGSDTFRGEWGTLMHLIISRGLYDYRGVQYVDNSFAVAKFSGLNMDPMGLPLRWSGEGPTGSGFSDHFPIFAKFVTVADNRADKYLALQSPAEEKAEPPVRRIDYAAIDLEKVAVRPDQLAPDVSIRTPANFGKLYRIEGRVVPSERGTSVEFRGETFEVFSHDPALRARLRTEFRPGTTVSFYGELGQYRGQWQFVIHDPSWVR